jgi:hypothetical protein
MRATSTYGVCKETCWINQNYPSGAGKSAELIDEVHIISTHQPLDWRIKFQAVLESQHTYGQNNTF